MSFGKMNEFAEIIRVTVTEDEEGFQSRDDHPIATIRVYHEERHSSLKWVNLAAFSEATDLFRFRRIPGVTVDTDCFITGPGGRYSVISAENVKGRGMYIEVLAKKVVGTVG